jgi:hypothetical protein
MYGRSEPFKAQLLARMPMKTPASPPFSALATDGRFGDRLNLSEQCTSSTAFPVGLIRVGGFDQPMGDSTPKKYDERPWRLRNL